MDEENRAELDESRPIIPRVLKEDKLLHYPYESIRPFLQLLNEAARDPEVVSIKMPLYCLASHSKVVDALVEAAENGKQVDVLVEMKARFDEENNIEWSRLLERAGCHVVYGIEGLKVHSKLCLITRKTQEGISFITQIGTGNYNEKNQPPVHGPVVPDGIQRDRHGGNGSVPCAGPVRDRGFGQESSGGTALPAKPSAGMMPRTTAAGARKFCMRFVCRGH